VESSDKLAKITSVLPVHIDFFVTDPPLTTTASFGGFDGPADKSLVSVWVMHVSFSIRRGLLPIVSGYVLYTFLSHRLYSYDLTFMLGFNDKALYIVLKHFNFICQL
jgi:hypothetical protein